MKSILKMMLAVSALFFATGLNAQEKKTIQTATIKTAIYCDHCKVCETCGPKFNQALLKEKGIQMVVLDDTAMTIKVTYNSKKTDLAKIKQAISKLGYDAEEVRADAAAYEGLDGCCKKA
jgi:periplasmic mercuric ion binding protein